MLPTSHVNFCSQENSGDRDLNGGESAMQPGREKNINFVSFL